MRSPDSKKGGERQLPEPGHLHNVDNPGLRYLPPAGDALDEIHCLAFPLIIDHLLKVNEPGHVAKYLPRARSGARASH